MMGVAVGEALAFGAYGMFDYMLMTGMGAIFIRIGINYMEYDKSKGEGVDTESSTVHQ